MAGAIKKVEMVMQIVLTLSDAEARELRFYLASRSNPYIHGARTGGVAVTDHIHDVIKAAQN